jgi:hypothetical protein
VSRCARSSGSMAARAPLPNRRSRVGVRPRLARSSSMAGRAGR